MSGDIPVGSPPVPPGRHAAPAGWYPDPADRSRERYWDGWQWHRDTRPMASTPPARPGFPARSGGTAPSGGPAAVPVTDDGVPLASWGHRFGAAAIDWLCLGVLSNIIVFVVQSITGADVRMQAAMNRYLAYVVEGLQHPEKFDAAEAIGIVLTQDFYIQLAMFFGIGVIYHLAFLGAVGATPGKLALGLRVVPAGQGLAPPGLAWGRAAARAVIWRLLTQFWTLLWLVLLLDVLWPLWDKKQRALHDRIVGTQVVRNPRKRG